MSISDWLRNRATRHEAVKSLVRRRWGQVQRGEYEVCLALRRLFEDNVHRHEGFSRFGDFADQRFGIPEKLADLFCFLAPHLMRLPQTRAAVEAGELGYTKAREFARIATTKDEARWIEFARTHTNRELERECRRARDGTEQDERKVTSRLTPTQVQTVRRAREMVMKQLDAPVPEAELLPVMSELFVNRDRMGENGMNGQNGANGTNLPDPAPRKPLPFLTINLCPECTHAYVPAPGENLRVPVEDWFEALKRGAEVHDLVADLLCDCEEVKHRRDRCPHAHSPAVKGEVPRNRHIPADVSRRVEARDGHRCRVPGCTCQVPLEKSHLKPFRNGTPSRPEYLAQHCATCNDLIETGRLVVAGEAPLETYHRADGELIGYGFDPRPHVGTSLRTVPSGDGDPPWASSAAD